MSCFFSHAGRTAIPALLSVALAAAACNKDGEITLPDSKPRITLDSETGVYAAKIGRAVTITPTVENEGEAAYSWTIDDEVVSTARVFEYVFNEEGRIYVTLRVENRAGYDEKEARIDVNRLAPRHLAHRAADGAIRAHGTGIHVRTGGAERRKRPLRMVSGRLVRTGLHRKGLHLHAHPTGRLLPAADGDQRGRHGRENGCRTRRGRHSGPHRVHPLLLLADPLVRSVSLGRTLFLRPQVISSGPAFLLLLRLPHPPRRLPPLRLLPTDGPLRFLKNWLRDSVRWALTE